MRRLLVAVLLLAAIPAQAQPENKQWADCVVEQLRSRDPSESPNWNGSLIAARCKNLFHGEPGVDVQVLIKLLENYQKGSQEPFVIIPSQPLPPADRKF